MPTRPITVTLGTIGASAGPFNISDDVLGVVAMGVTRAQLLAGYVVDSDVNASAITINSVGVCTNSIVIPLPTPTPTPTPTPGPTATPTPTPTPTPLSISAYYDVNYTGISDICGDGGRAWSRLTASSGSIVELTINVNHPVPNTDGSTAIILGSLYDTTLPSTYPVEGTLLAAVSSSVASVDTPTLLNNSITYNVTIPASGYQDLLLIYRTYNLAGLFTSGNATATITALNGSPVTGGGFITATYGCTE